MVFRGIITNWSKISFIRQLVSVTSGPHLHDDKVLSTQITKPEQNTQRNKFVYMLTL